MVGSLSLSVNENISSIAVGAEQDGILFDCRLGKTWPMVHCLEKRVGDAICKPYELNAGIVVAPFWD